jgi:Importin beta binding domain
MKGLYKSRSLRLDSNGQRQRRIEEGQSLRKEKREDELSRRRSSSSAPVDEMETLIEDVDMLKVTNDEENSKKEWIKLLYSEIVYDQLGAVEKFARLINRKPELESELIEMGLLPRFFELLQSHQNLRLQQRAGMVLTDLTNQKVINALPANAVQILTDILESNVDEEVVDHVITILGNIAGESATLRDQVLDSSAWPKLLQILESATESRLLNSAFTLRNLCLNNQSTPNFTRISMCLPLLVQLIRHEDYEIN